jgi:hypothetical protein
MAVVSIRLRDFFARMASSQPDEVMIPQGPSWISCRVGWDFPIVFEYHIISTKVMRYAIVLSTTLREA